MSLRTPAAAQGTPGPRRIAIVWNYPSRLRDCSFRFEQYIAGFRALGHDVVMVCTTAAAEGFTAPYHCCESREQFAAAAFWREVGADVAVMATWHGMSEVLAAMQEAGTAVVAFADTDGQTSLSVFPRAALRMRLAEQPLPGAKVRELGRGLRQFAVERIRGSWLDRELLRSTRLSDSVVFGHEAGRRHFERFLAHYGASDLAPRLAVVPFTIGSACLSCPVPVEKDDAVVAIGRWGAPQKHTARLSDALSRFLGRRPSTRVDLFGADGEEPFGRLLNSCPSVTYHGLAGPDVLARALGKARAIVFASRWEGCPHAALEALAMGATIVGTPIPSLASWTADGRYGRVSRWRTAGSLARALAAEMRAWDKRQRDPQAIAAAWRERLRPEAVCQDLLSLPPKTKA